MGNDYTWPVPELDDLDVIFGTNVTEWMPQREDIPEEFKFMRNTAEENEIVSTWFFKGLNPKVKFIPRDGVNAEEALAALKSLMGSFQPKHEHKEEAAAFLMRCWFKKIKNWKP